MSSSVEVLTMADDEHFRDGASADLRARERFVVDHHIGGKGVDRRGVGINQHRVGGAYGLQVSGRLASSGEVVEEPREKVRGAAGACVRCRLVGEANLADKIGEAAGRANSLNVTQ